MNQQSLFAAFDKAANAPPPAQCYEVHLEPASTAEQTEKKPRGRPPKNPAAPKNSSNLAQKRAAVGEIAALAAEEMYEKQSMSAKKSRSDYINWSDAEKADALFALGKCGGNIKNAFNYIRNPSLDPEKPVFSQNLQTQLTESTFRSWAAAAKKKLDGIALKQRGRPPVLRETTIKAIEKAFLDAVDAATQLHNSVSLRELAREVIIDCGEEDVLLQERLKLSKTWINSICIRLGLTMRVPTKASKQLPGDWEAQGENFMLKLAYLLRNYNLTAEDVFNFDQTAVQFNPQANGGKTRAIKGSKDVTVKNHDDKRQITVVPTINAAGEALPLQLIVKGTLGNDRAIPDSKNKFKNLEKLYPGSLYAQTPNHWSTKETNLSLIRDIILPFAKKSKEKRREQGKTVGNKIIIILDCWPVQKSAEFRDAVYSEFPEVMLLYVPPNLTGKFQPLDVAVNSVFKQKVKFVFSVWATEEYMRKKNEGKRGDDLLMSVKMNKDTKMQLFKWIHDGWRLVEEETIKRGWREAGLLKAFEADMQDRAVDMENSEDPNKKLWPRKEGSADLKAVPKGIDAALGANYEKTGDETDEIEGYNFTEKERAELETLADCLGDCEVESDEDGGGDIDEDEACMASYWRRERGEGKRPSKPPQKLRE